MMYYLDFTPSFQEFVDFRVNRNKMLRSRKNQILLPFSFWGDVKQRESSNIYELRSYTLKVGLEVGRGGGDPKTDTVEPILIDRCILYEDMVSEKIGGRQRPPVFTGIKMYFLPEICGLSRKGGLACQLSLKIAFAMFNNWEGGLGKFKNC